MARLRPALAHQSGGVGLLGNQLPHAEAAALAVGDEQLQVHVLGLVALPGGRL